MQCEAQQAYPPPELEPSCLYNTWSKSDHMQRSYRQNDFGIFASLNFDLSV